jgi:hypothetical protein
MKGEPTVGKKVDVQRCIDLYKSGMSMSQAGRIMGHHPGVLRYHLVRSGIPIRTAGECRRLIIPSQKIADMYISGMSATEVAKELGITYQCVYDRLAEVGVKTRTRQEQIKMMISRGTYNLPMGEKSKLWRGGTTFDSNGYKYINVGGGYIAEHRLIWEKHNGPLPSRWVIHHLNGIKTDNRIENLSGVPRKEHSPKKITEPYKKRILELELELKSVHDQHK